MSEATVADAERAAQTPEQTKDSGTRQEPASAEKPARRPIRHIGCAC